MSLREAQDENRASRLSLPHGDGSTKEKLAYVEVEKFMALNPKASVADACVARKIDPALYYRARQKLTGIKAPKLEYVVPAQPKVDLDVSREKLWARCVEAAKQHIAQVSKARLEITKLAMECCDIRRGGGGHWTDHEGIYTVKKFAQEIGMNYKTLTNWIACYRGINAGLPPGEYKEEDYKFAMTAVKKLGRFARPQDLITEFRRQRDSSKITHKLSMIITWARSHKNFVQRSDLSKMDQEELRVLRELFVESAQIIDKHFGET